MPSRAGSDPEAGRKRAHPTWLYARLLGGAWTGLPAPLKSMHAVEGPITAVGKAKVERGQGLLSRLVALLAGFPPASDDVEVKVTIERRGDVEIWRRDFGGHVFQSTQETGRERRLLERFGPAAFPMVLNWDGKRLNLRLRGWRLFGLPMPAWTSPVSTAWESVEGGRFRFFVQISHPMTGLIVRYQGWLEPIIFATGPAQAT